MTTAPGPGWFDSHCHLQERYLADEAPDPAGGPVAEVLRRAVAAGVSSVVCVGTDAATSAQALALAGAVADGDLGPGLPGVSATAGLHPHEASAGTAAVADLIERSAAGSLVGIGECGLDYHYDFSPRPAQREAFAAQVGMAKDHGLALVVHTREAWEDTFSILASQGTPERTVFHCFTGGPAEASQALDMGAWLSFSGIITFKNASDIRAAAALCPLDRLLVETDSPFLAPVPHRGKPNSPALVPLVGAAVAAVKGIDVVAVEEATWLGAAQVFGLP